MSEDVAGIGEGKKLDLSFFFLKSVNVLSSCFPSSQQPQSYICIVTYLLLLEVVGSRNHVELVGEEV